MQTNVKSNQDKYGDVIAALNYFYWDNSISPNETAAKLDELSQEASRLAKYIRDNAPAPDSAVVPTTDAPDTTVGDSDSVSQHSTDNASGLFWMCSQCGEMNKIEYIDCALCLSPRWVSPNKPDDRTPSSTPLCG